MLSRTNRTKSGKMRTQCHEKPPQPEPLLLPKGHTSSNSRNAADREKHSRLNGADMYVARLGWWKGAAESQATAPDLPSIAFRTSEPDANNDPASSTASTLPSGRFTGSLHDELLNRTPSPSPPSSSPSSTTLPLTAVRASRPCYRCITYMHRAGIKRVFWTNDAGAWEGGKVRDLVDALDDPIENAAGGFGGQGVGERGFGGPMGNGVFVTKHEVLMLKMMMGWKEMRGG